MNEKFEENMTSYTICYSCGKAKEAVDSITLVNIINICSECKEKMQHTHTEKNNKGD